MSSKKRLARRRMIPGLLVLGVIGGFLVPTMAQDSSVYDDIWGTVLDTAEQLMPFDPGSSLPVYQIRHVERATLAVILEADEFGLVALVEGEWGDEAASPEERDEYWLLRGDEVKATAFYASSFVSVVNIERAYIGECQISEIDAIDLAFDHVAHVGAGYGHETFELYDVVRFWSQAASPDGETSDSVLATLAVVFNKRINGIPVVGPGGKVVFLITGEGEIVGIHRNVRLVDPTPLDEQPLIGLDAFADAFVEALWMQFGDEPPFTADEFSIEKFEAGLFSDAKRHQQQYLQPAYALMYVIETDDFVYASDFILPALVEPYEPFVGVPDDPVEVEEATTSDEEGEKE